ncbi:DUF885 domain-containing protein [Sphingomonas sp. G124]|uniref:DUF885 domain-containing protein n=1 Tax=Sphingomonas cremea TaxID=2904799 RepID=A0A9X1TWU8_9SPHN|nr:DUF885 domain-containing protein [Sphingomonas cremea]MCF2515799.1 DUF885 domain-containing protein [Sphingomonas cremea]
MRIRTTLLAATMLAFAAPALAGPVEDFQKLQDDYWAATLRDSPLFATQVGVKDYDRQIGPLSLVEMDRQAAQAAAFLKQLDAISAASLPPADQANRAVLKRQLEDAIEANRYGERQLLYSTLGSYHDYLAGMADGIPFRSAGDYDNYLARLELVPDRMRSYGEISVKAAREGYVQPCVTMTNFAGTITGNISADPTQSRFYTPFAVQKPENVPATEWAAFQARAKALITAKINPAYQAFADLYDRDLKAKCRQSVGVSAMPQGREYYAFQVRQQTTTNLTPDEIHQLGLREVARIRAEMVEVAKKAGFASREAMIADMRTNPKWFAKSPDELLQVTALMAKTIDGKMPSLFGRLPRLPYGIRPMALATAPGDTTARYQPGSPDAGIAGFYLVNTTKLDQRPFWEIPALTVHEAVPGHHMQIALQQELDMPDWRRNTAFFTAFVEGWGLYSERLGIEMGIYDTPQRDMGRLGYEMWRASRLVVDTGIHSKGWTKEQAVAFMKDNTTLTDANIDAEVNRYISNPGQALAYKLGELKIRELRAKAERELGPKFDLRRFHDAVLGQGAVPLDALEAQINAWIAAEETRA